MMIIKVSGNGIERLEKAMRGLTSGAAGKAMATALNEVGRPAKRKVVSAVAKQVGLPVKTVEKRGGIATTIAYPNRLNYTIRATGRYLLLKDFKPTQIKKGVKASPWGRRRLFGGAFINSGVFGNVMHRVGLPRRMKFGRYAGKIRQPIENMFGPAIPKEIIRGASEKVFKTYVAERLPRRVDHQLKRAAKGIFD